MKRSAIVWAIIVGSLIAFAVVGRIAESGIVRVAAGDPNKSWHDAKLTLDNAAAIFATGSATSPSAKDDALKNANETCIRAGTFQEPTTQSGQADQQYVETACRAIAP